MDRNYYYQKRTEEHQREVSQELATRHLLNETGLEPLKAKRLMRFALRLVPVAIVLIVLVVLSFFA